MEIDKKAYSKFAKQHAPRSPLLKNCINAFICGGLICTLGEALFKLYYNAMLLPEKDSGTLVSVTLVFIAALLTGIGVFDNIAKVAGAGTLVPITGFSNAVTSPAIDTKAEGWVLGVGAKIFTVAGPVLLYGTLAGAIWGIVYWIGTLY